MKKLASVLLLAISMQVMSQVPTSSKSNGEMSKIKKTCQPIVALKITSSANNLIDSYKKLFENKENLCNSSSNILTSFGLMSLKHYSNPQPGKVSFASFNEGIDLFRTIWGAVEGSFAYYGVCAPNPIVWEANIASQNHVWALKFVTIDNYVKTASPKNFLDFTGVPIADIKSIDCIKIEEANGYVAATEPLLYESTHSSRGLLAYLTLTNGTQIICYIVNNYDNSGTLAWKE
jgi:hypothetical protein